MTTVYILQCADGSYYTGQTANLEQRLAQHQTGAFGGYTAARRPVRLVWHQDVQTDDEAFRLERKLKGWSREKKAALIAGDFARLHEIVSRERKVREARQHT